MTVYVVEVGEFDDTQTVGVYSTAQKAELIIARIKIDEPNVSCRAFVLDQGLAELNKGLKPFEIRLDYDGKVEYLDDPALVSDVLGHPEFSIESRTTAPYYIGHDNVSDALTARVWAKDAGKALAKTNKQRLKLIEEGKLNKR